MKTAHPQRWLEITIVGLLLFDHAPLRAQSTSSTSTPVAINPIGQPASEGDASAESAETKPWGKGTLLEDRLAAEALFMEGNRLFRIPLFARAAAQYTAALAKWQHPAFNFNLALAQINLGQDVEARENLERSIRYGAEPLGAEQFEEAKKQLRELERQLARIRISCQTPGAVVTLDGVTLFTGPGTHQGWIKPKTHELTARKKEYLSETRQVTTIPGQLEQIELKLVTLDEAADANRRWATWKPWAVIGAGVAIAGAGGAFHFLSARNMNAYDEGFLRLGCGSNQALPGCNDSQIPAELSDQRTRARQQQTIAVGSYLAGGAVIATGVVLWYLNRPRLAEHAPSSSGRRIAVLPAVSSDVVGLVVSVDR